MFVPTKFWTVLGAVGAVMWVGAVAEAAVHRSDAVEGLALIADALPVSGELAVTTAATTAVDALRTAHPSDELRRLPTTLPSALPSPAQRRHRLDESIFGGFVRRVS